MGNRDGCTLSRSALTAPGPIWGNQCRVPIASGSAKRNPIPHSPSQSHSLCHSHSHSQAIVRVSIVTCCNKLKLTKSVRSHWGCQSDWLPPPAPAAAAAATCGVQLVEQLAGSACSHLALARLDNKCQHFAAANLFARLMRAPIAGGPCFYVAATAVAPLLQLPLRLLLPLGHTRHACR